MKLKALLLVLVGLVLSSFAIAQEKDGETLEDRIKPVGSVHVAGAQAATPASAGPRSGADVYGTACVACHGAGVLGAPKLQDAADWGPRMEKGFDEVLANAINGFKAMPAKGGCMACSDEEIKVAIEHMIEGI